jgi:hypothetical protein
LSATALLCAGNFQYFHCRQVSILRRVFSVCGGTQKTQDKPLICFVVIKTKQDCISVLEYLFGFPPYAVSRKQLLCQQRLFRRLILKNFKSSVCNIILSTGSFVGPAGT